MTMYDSEDDDSLQMDKIPLDSTPVSEKVSIKSFPKFQKKGLFVLDYLSKVKQSVESSEVNSKKFQPNELEQKRLIARNEALRMVSASIKKETIKYLYKQTIEVQKIKREEEKLKEARKRAESMSLIDPSSTSSNQEDTSLSHPSSSHSVNSSSPFNSLKGPSTNKYRSQRKNDKKNNQLILPSYSFNNPSSSAENKENSLLNEIHQNNDTESKNYTIKLKCLLEKNHQNFEETFSLLCHQSMKLTRDSLKLFNGIFQGYEQGKAIQFCPKKLYEEVNLSAFSTHQTSAAALLSTATAALNQGTSHSSSSTALSSGSELNPLLSSSSSAGLLSQNNANSTPSLINKSELLNNTINNALKKREGLLLIVDPSTNSDGKQILLRITYKKMIDVLTEEEVVRDYLFSSTGNYYNLNLMKETNRSLPSLQATDYSASAIGSRPSLSTSSTAPTGALTQSIIIDDEINSNVKFTNEIESTAIPSTASTAERENTGESQNDCSSCLPGWGTCLPIFIPSLECKLEILNINEIAKYNVTTANRVSRLRVFLTVASNVKSGLRKLHDYCKQFALFDVVNTPLCGGITPLNYACFYGNLEAVKHLLACGASMQPHTRSLTTVSYIHNISNGLQGHIHPHDNSASSAASSLIQLPSIPHNIYGAGADDSRRTALHVAVLGNQPNIIALLLQCGANQLLRDESGMTPLHYACKANNITLAVMLATGPRGKLALLSTSQTGERPVDLVKNNLLLYRLENIMRKLRIYVKPRS